MDSELSRLSNSPYITHWENYPSQTLPTDSTDEPTNMAGSTGQDIVDQYTFLVGFVFAAQQNPGGSISGQLSLQLVQGCEFVNHGFGFDVLIGRDILCKGAFSLSFDGHYSLCF